MLTQSTVLHLCKNILKSLSVDHIRLQPSNLVTWKWYLIKMASCCYFPSTATQQGVTVHRNTEGTLFKNNLTWFIHLRQLEPYIQIGILRYYLQYAKPFLYPDWKNSGENLSERSDKLSSPSLSIGPIFPELLNLRHIIQSYWTIHSKIVIWLAI